MAGTDYSVFDRIFSHGLNTLNCVPLVPSVNKYLGAPLLTFQQNDVSTKPESSNNHANKHSEVTAIANLSTTVKAGEAEEFKIFVKDGENGKPKLYTSEDLTTGTRLVNVERFISGISLSGRHDVPSNEDVMSQPLQSDDAGHRQSVDQGSLTNEDAHPMEQDSETDKPTHQTNEALSSTNGVIETNDDAEDNCDMQFDTETGVDFTVEYDNERKANRSFEDQSFESGYDHDATYSEFGDIPDPFNTNADEGIDTPANIVEHVTTGTTILKHECNEEVMVESQEEMKTDSTTDIDTEETSSNEQDITDTNKTPDPKSQSNANDIYECTDKSSNLDDSGIVINEVSKCVQSNQPPVDDQRPNKDILCETNHGEQDQGRTENKNLVSEQISLECDSPYSENINTLPSDFENILMKSVVVTDEQSELGQIGKQKSTTCNTNVIVTAENINTSVSPEHEENNLKTTEISDSQVESNKIENDTNIKQEIGTTDVSSDDSNRCNVQSEEMSDKQDLITKPERIEIDGKDSVKEIPKSLDNTSLEGPTFFLVPVTNDATCKPENESAAKKGSTGSGTLANKYKQDEDRNSFEGFRNRNKTYKNTHQNKSQQKQGLKRFCSQCSIEFSTIREFKDHAEHCGESKPKARKHKDKKHPITFDDIHELSGDSSSGFEASNSENDSEKDEKANKKPNNAVNENVNNSEIDGSNPIANQVGAILKQIVKEILEEDSNLGDLVKKAADIKETTKTNEEGLICDQCQTTGFLSVQDLAAHKEAVHFIVDTAESTEGTNKHGTYGLRSSSKDRKDGFIPQSKIHDGKSGTINCSPRNNGQGEPSELKRCNICLRCYTRKESDMISHNQRFHARLRARNLSNFESVLKPNGSTNSERSHASISRPPVRGRSKFVGAPLNTYKCKECFAQFNSFRTLKAHIAYTRHHLTHSFSERGHEVFTNRDTVEFRTQENIFHEDPKDWSCEECGELFNCRQEFNDHMRDEHGVNKEKENSKQGNSDCPRRHHQNKVRDNNEKGHEQKGASLDHNTNNTSTRCEQKGETKEVYPLKVNADDLRNKLREKEHLKSTGDDETTKSHESSTGSSESTLLDNLLTSSDVEKQERTLNSSKDENKQEANVNNSDKRVGMPQDKTDETKGENDAVKNKNNEDSRYGSRNIYKCQLCKQKTFTSQFRLDLHMRRLHSTGYRQTSRTDASTFRVRQRDQKTNAFKHPVDLKRKMTQTCQKTIDHRKPHLPQRKETAAVENNRSSRSPNRRYEENIRSKDDDYRSKHRSNSIENKEKESTLHQPVTDRQQSTETSDHQMPNHSQKRRHDEKSKHLDDEHSLPKRRQFERDQSASRRFSPGGSAQSIESRRGSSRSSADRNRDFTERYSPGCERHRYDYRKERRFSREQVPTRETIPKYNDRYYDSEQTFQRFKTFAPSYACRICEEIFKTRVDLFEHLAEVHKKKSVMANRGQSVKCRMCSSSFPNMGLLRQHVAKEKHYMPFNNESM